MNEKIRNETQASHTHYIKSIAATIGHTYFCTPTPNNRFQNQNNQRNRNTSRTDSPTLHLNATDFIYCLQEKHVNMRCALHRGICIGISIRLQATPPRHTHSLANAIHWRTDIQTHGAYRKRRLSVTHWLEALRCTKLFQWRDLIAWISISFGNFSVTHAILNSVYA